MGTRSGSKVFLQRLLRGSAAVAIGLLMAGCKTELYSKVSEQDANDMVGVLSSGGIAASKASPDGKTWSVMVEESAVPQALERLREQGLPRDRFQSLGDVFKKEGLVSTPSEERIRFVYAMSQELSRTLSQIDGVVSARVHVVIPANDPLVDKVVPASASVFIKHRRGLDTVAVTPAVKTLVHRSIEGLTYENTSVTFFPADTPALPPQQSAASVSASVVSILAALLAATAAAALLWFQPRVRERARAALDTLKQRRPWKKQPKNPARTAA